MSVSRNFTDAADIDYALLFRYLPDRALLLEVDDPDFTVRDQTEAHAIMTGLDRQKVIGKPLFATFPDVSEKYQKTGVSDLLEGFRKVIRTKKPNEQRIFRYDIPDAAGTFRMRYWRTTNHPIFDDKHHLKFVLQVAIDATAEHLAQEKLEQMQVSLQEALEIGKVGQWLWNLEEDRIIADKNLANLFGLPQKEAREGLPLETFLGGVYATDRVRIRKAIQRVQKYDESFDEEYRTHTRDGSVRWAIARGKVIKQDGKRIFSGVIVDVTERRDLQLQVELARKQDKLNRREADILQTRNKELEALSRTKDEFVALASHQLRTPATAVKQYLGMVLQGYAGKISDVQTEMLGKAFESNERQIQIINQILNAARVDTGRLVMTMVPLDVRKLVRGVCDEMRAEIKQKGHSFTVTIARQELPITADLGYLRMAVENLIHNASIYTPSGGTITVTVDAFAGRVRIRVRDSGVGIRKADIPRLFTKFSRIHNPLSVQAGGSGIGLYLAAEIVRLHGGKLTVDSKLHVGTTFAILLPLEQNKNSTGG